jgi:6-pyruvoyltetrahydropterin/6-carboxytetrahydropterin synthase
MYELTVESTFSAAHQLIGSNGPCEELHGHTWKVQVTVAGNELDKIGMLFDFKELKKVLSDILKRYDHAFLNKVFYFSPTAENIAKNIFQEFKKKNNLVRKISVWESPTSCASYCEG